MYLRRSVRRRGIIVIALLVLYTVTGFFILPPIVRSQLEKRLSAELGRRVTVGKLRLNPYTLSATVENFAIREPDGTSLFLGWQRLYTNFGAWASLRREWVLSDVALAGFQARTQVNPDHSLNFSDLLTKFAPPATSSSAATSTASAKPARPVRIGRLQVTGAKIEIADLSRSRLFKTTLGPLTFELTEFRTVSERGAPYRFAAVTEAGEKLTWSGSLRAEPFQSAGELVLEDIELSKYEAFYADRVQAEIATGKLSVRGRYVIDLTEGQRSLMLQDGTMQIRGLTVRERGTDQTAVELPSFDIAGVQANALTQKATIGSITLAGGHLRARREKDGSINLLTMLTPAPAKGASAAVTLPAPSAPTTTTGPAKTPDVYIGEVAVKDFQVEISDLAAPRPAQLSLQGLQLSLKDFTLTGDTPMPLQLAFGWAPQGTVRLAGTVGLAPIKANLKGEVGGFEILPLSPYLEQFMNARLTQGAVSATFAALASLPSGKPLEASVTGDVTVEKLGLVDSSRNEELAGFSRLMLRGIRASTAPTVSVALDEIEVTRPYARVVVNADKSINLADVAKTAPGAPAPGVSATAASPATPPPAVEIGKITISEGDFRFTDRSLNPAVSMAIAQFSGTITGLSSTNLAKADVDLFGTVNEADPVSIAGKLDPLGQKPSIDLKIDVKNMDLLPLSPYSAKYAGFELARGKLLLDVKLLVDGKKIDANNVVTLNQFTFGEPVASPDATKLPVRLGVALLKDTEGKIVIDVPVQGSTDDPNFRIGRVVGRVIVNLLTKVATSPFSLLGAAFGGGGDELAFQEFTPGTAALQETEIKKLQTLVQALTNRPGLSLNIEGSYDPVVDVDALKRTKLTERVRRTVWETKRATDPNIPPPEELVLTPGDTFTALQKLYDAAFSPGTEVSTPLPATPVVAAPPPAPPPEEKKFFRRALDTITFRRKRSSPPPAPEAPAVVAAVPSSTEVGVFSPTAPVVAAAPPAPPQPEKKNFFRRALDTITFRRKDPSPPPASLPPPTPAAPPVIEAPKPATAPILPPEEMSARLAETIPVDDNDLRALAQERAQTVRTYFTDVGKISPDRLFLSKELTNAAKPNKASRVFLHLQ